MAEIHAMAETHAAHLFQQTAEKQWLVTTLATNAECPLSTVHLQRRNERLLWDFHLAELAHALFAGFLLVEELSLA